MKKIVALTVLTLALCIGVCGCVKTNTDKKDEEIIASVASIEKTEAEKSDAEKTKEEVSSQPSIQEEPDTSVEESSENTDAGRKEFDEKRIAVTTEGEPAVYEVELEAFGKVSLVSYKKEGTPDDVSLLIVKDGEILYRLPESEADWWFEAVKNIEVKDLDGDGLKDIVETNMYITGIGPEGVIPFASSKVYLAHEKEFVYAPDYYIDDTDDGKDDDEAGDKLMSARDVLEKALNDCQDGTYSYDYGALYQPSFAVLDLNKDGKEDVLINGVIGIRALESTLAFVSGEKGYSCLEFNGYLSSCYEDFFVISYDDHDVTATWIENGMDGVTFDNNGKCNRVFEYYLSQYWGNPETEEEYDEPVTDRECYTLWGLASSQKEIVEYINNSIKLEMPSFEALTRENVEKAISSLK